MNHVEAPTSPQVVTSPIPPAILEEIETFETEAQRTLVGEISTDLFRPFRLQYGIYGQRQPGVQMVRIKIPFGGITANQLRRVAELTDRYATGVGHVTTRQDIQMHFVELKDVPTIMRGLAEVGLTTREACANTVRNVTACHLAGVCQGEVFDVTPYAKTVAYHLLRNPLNQSLPRKFKIAFSGCKHDCALTPIHDIGLLAVKRSDGVIGFRMVAGGGLGSAPRVAQLLREFTPMEELIPSIEAVIKVFDTLGNRKNRNKARMKFVIDKLGFDEFKRRWEAAYVSMGHALPKNGTLTLLQHHDNPLPLLMPTRNGGATGNGTGGRNGAHAIGHETPFEMWKRTNVVTQKQEGYVTAAIKLFMGDITAEQMLFVADLAERYSNGNLRTTINQNMVIRWIPADRIAELYEDLASRGLADPGAELVEDIIACPGTDTCGLGITSSKGLARALAEVFPAGRVPEDLAGVDVKISGCHNSCAQHHISTIGLHGVGKRLGDHVAPHYELHLGGSVNGTAKVGKMIVKLPAQSVPAAISHLIDVYRRDRHENENLPKFIERAGKNKLKDELIPYTIVPSYEEDSTFYYDWEGEAEFILEDLGPGECAGGALEMIENGILEADQELYQAKLLVEKHQYSVSVNKSYRAVLAAAKAMLVTEGLEPSTDSETFIEFDSRIAQKGVIPAQYRELNKKVGDLGPKDTTAESARDKMVFAKGFVDACRAATEQMGKDLKLAPVRETTAAMQEVPAPVVPIAAEVKPATPAPTGAPVYDLRGVACPMNYVKTKLKLEMMDAGEKLEVWLDAGEPIKNVPMSLKNDGHKVLIQEALEPDASHYRILVEKVEE
ncbi:sulfurtransferase TusA family protein [Candidatus Nitrospira nitrificans]|uniref:Putative Sulfite reductase, contains SirA-like domain (Modular protein) n=1 Tax=Candidatus Nitrospira nitrificans TaxID=1742973 RepID=A0A0S4LI38_9BACT|nr:sulfurtransferase TusA family protein [Candidatus Nitrospira nitrificans]CUS35595.1 putative Sulfite reductase, contains SirA-like domain (Modular protein) [Candidatus Nitrospira nitrificans]